MRILTFFVVGLLITVGVAACGVTTGPTSAPSAAPTGSLVPPSTGQTDTEWGRIWDALPADFPTYPGATPSEEAANGPASATLVVDGTDAKTVTTWTAAHLALQSYDVQKGGPMEDGGYVIDGDGKVECSVHLDIVPLGTVTTITILYGAACPNT